MTDPDDHGIIMQSPAEREGEFTAVMEAVRACGDPLCLHPRGEHHPWTGECWVEEQVARAYVDGGGIHDSVFDRCRCGGWK